MSHSVTAQIVRLISANEWGVTTEFWHFDFSAYLKHSTYGIMGSYRTFVHYVRKKKKKNPYWGHMAKNSGQKWDFAILEILEFEYFPFGSFGSDPGFEQWSPTAAQSIFQIQKGQTGSLWTRPPPFGTSAENPGAHDLSRYLSWYILILVVCEAYM